MEILVDIKWLLGVMGFHKNVRSKDLRRDYIHRTIYSIGLILTNISFIWFLFDDPDVIMEPLFGVVNAFSITAIYLGFVFRCDRILELFDELQLKVEERMATKARSIYQEAIDRAETTTTRSSSLMLKWCAPTYSIPVILYSLFEYYIRKRSSFEVIFYMELPYDYRSPIPYLFTMFLEVSEMYAMATALVAGYNTLYGMCIIVIAFIDDLQQCLHDMDEKIKAKESAAWTMKTTIEVKKAYNEFIQLHADVQQLVTRLDNAYSDIMSALFLHGLLYLCIALLHFHIGVRTGDPRLVIRTLATIGSWGALFGIFSNFGENFSTAFDNLNLSIYNVSWNLCPVKFQKLNALMTTVSLKPVQLQGFAGIACSLNTFGRILNNAFSYYMVLRRMD